VKSGRNADMYSSLTPFSPEQRTKVDQYMQAFYDQFVEKVAESRKSTPERIDQLAQGRVWTGQQARDNGLVDVLGGLTEAIGAAKDLAKIPADSDVEIAVYPRPRSFYELLAERLSGSQQVAIGRWVAASLAPGELEALRAIRMPFALFRRGEALALMPSAFLR
jgi:protease-4